MAESKPPDVLRDSGPAPDLWWKDDPYGGVDVSMMRELLKMTPAERFRYAVDAANFFIRTRGLAQKR